MDEYAARRGRFAEQFPEGIAVIFAGNDTARNSDTDYEFRQQADFYYLTGFSEPDAVAVITGGNAPTFRLFVRPRDQAAELWTGRRYGVEGAVKQFGADEAFPIAELDERLPSLLLGKKTLVYELGERPESDRRILEAVKAARTKVRRGGTAPREFVVASRFLHEMRVKKSPSELTTLRRAAEITAIGFDAAMRATASDLSEYQIEALMEGEYRKLGAQDVAYPSIVAGGANATILHYSTNRDKLVAGDLVLVDSGCELDLYASDVTRTWPISGKFSAEQRALYEIVLAAQLAAIDAVRPGRKFNEYHKIAVRVITEGLVDLKLLSGSIDELLEREAYKTFYPHSTGHWLGLDVHDAGDYTDDAGYRALEPEMVLTVEPGIYVQTYTDCDPRFHGIGIRIEDDVRVTGGEPDVLTHMIPKSILDLEALIGAAHKGQK